MKHVQAHYRKPLRFPLWSRVNGKANAPKRYQLINGGIRAEFGNGAVLPYANHMEMSGFKISTILSFQIKRDRTPLFYRFCVFPALRILPNDTGGSLTYAFPGVALTSAGAKERVYSVSFDGILKFESTLGAVSVIRRFLPCRSKAALIEELQLKSDRIAHVTLFCKKNKKTVAEKFSATGKAHHLTTTVFSGATVFAPEKDTILVNGEKTIYIVYASEPLTLADVREQIAQRTLFLEETRNRLVIETPEAELNQMCEFTKLRASESIFQTKNGLMHAPGGGGYYAALWTNDQCEYANPLFAYLGYKKAQEQSVNCYRLYAKLARSNRAIYSSIIAEGDDYWHGAGDRGDSSMYIYGLARYLLTAGDKKLVQEFLPALETAAEYVCSQMTEDGVVKSDSDELENRFESGDANLSTAVISYDAFLSMFYLENALGRTAKGIFYKQCAEKIRTGIQTYFEAEVEGYRTYRYCAQESRLRSWICLPLTVGINDRLEDTVKALQSDKLKKPCGLLTRSGEKTYWDRSLLYALRGLFYADCADEALEMLREYTNTRLLGEHVPYPIEAFPEGNAAHLSAESALYVRIFTEGVLGFRPVSFDSFQIKPALPKVWNAFSVTHMEVFGKRVDFSVSRTEDGYRICVNTAVYNAKNGQTLSIQL